YTRGLSNRPRKIRRMPNTETSGSTSIRSLQKPEKRTPLIAEFPKFPNGQSVTSLHSSVKCWGSTSQIIRYGDWNLCSRSTPRQLFLTSLKGKHRLMVKL